jgi:hypothetical protein
MDAQDIRNLSEAYMEVYQQLDELTPATPRNIKRLVTKREKDARRAQDRTGHNLTPEYKKYFRTLQRNKVWSISGRPSSRPTEPASTNEETDLYDIILSHLLDEGYAETPEAAEAIMVNMSEGWREDIVEGGFNSSGRYDVGGGRTVGHVAGAVRSLFSGNLPKGQTYVPPSPRTGVNRPPAVPSSKDDSGKLTDFGAGGGNAKMKTGMTAGQVERQGRRNRGDYSG